MKLLRTQVSVYVIRMFNSVQSKLNSKSDILILYSNSRFCPTSSPAGNPVTWLLRSMLFVPAKRAYTLSHKRTPLCGRLLILPWPTAIFS